MARRLTDSFFSSIYFWLSIIIFLCFFVGTWYINRSVQDEAEGRINLMTTNIARSNIQVVSNMLDDYDEDLSFIQVAIENGEENRFDQIVKSFKLAEPSIHSIHYAPQSFDVDSLRKRSLYEEGGQLYFKFTQPVKNGEQICLLVNLQDFHKRVADSRIVNSAYTTISYEGKYLYHPNEKKIGQNIPELDREIEKKLINVFSDTITTTISDYLELPVYSYYRMGDGVSSEWMFTANLPNLGISDSVEKTVTDFMMVSVFAVLCFLAVIGLGMSRWRKEVLHRREVEQENMNLLLKNEQHKQTMIATELERLKSGLNPHFLFNSLGSLRVLISKDAEVAKYFAITLSNVYRYMLKQENHNTVTVREELEFTVNYINLQKIRFANKIVEKIDIPEEVLECDILPISLQLLVENCIKHTKISDEEPLQIQIYVDGNFIVVVNNYNPREYHDSYSGKGIDNLIKRYAILTNEECLFEIRDGYYFAKIPVVSHSRIC